MHRPQYRVGFRLGCHSSRRHRRHRLGRHRRCRRRLRRWRRCQRWRQRWHRRQRRRRRRQRRWRPRRWRRCRRLEWHPRRKPTRYCGRCIWRWEAGEGGREAAVDGGEQADSSVWAEEAAEGSNRFVRGVDCRGSATDCPHLHCANECLRPERRPRGRPWALQPDAGRRPRAEHSHVHDVVEELLCEGRSHRSGGVAGDDAGERCRHQCPHHQHFLTWLPVRWGHRPCTGYFPQLRC
mmetsp:Transcript_68832/g.197374  ORF Transcript_68832/g.197374 Transcript_68832/m.197374 type:complete len:237 (-) Transcript_68832:1303-2013(-)